MVICKYCSSSLSNRSNLERHQRTEKCKKAQEEYNIEKKVKSIIELKMKNTITKYEQDNRKLDEELNNFKQENKIQKQEIDQLKRTIKDLTDWKDRQIKKLEKKLNKTTDVIIEQAKQPKVVKNSTVNNTFNYAPIKPIDLSYSKLDYICKTHLTVDIIKDIVNRLSSFAKEFIIETEDKELTYICTDKNRGEFKYREKNGELVSDHRAIKFTKVLLEVADPYIDKLVEDMKPKREETDNEDDKMRKQMNTKIKLYNEIIQDINEFRKNPLNRKFWKNLAIEVYVEPNKRRIEKNEIKHDKIDEKKIYQRKQFKPMKLLKINEDFQEEKYDGKKEKDFEKQIEREIEEGRTIIQGDPDYKMNKWLWENQIKIHEEQNRLKEREK